MDHICKHAYPRELCGTCNPPAKEKRNARRSAAACSVSSVRERYTSLAKAGRKYMPQLEIDHQSFHVWYDYTTKKQAEWVRDQLASALFRMISQNAGILAQPTNDSTDTKNER